MNQFLRVIRYIKIHLARDPLYLFLYSIHFFNPRYVPLIRYYPVDTINDLLLKNKSIIRLGDGEIFILNGGSLPGQKFDEDLRIKLLACIEGYTVDSPYVLCLNKIPLAKSNRQLSQEGLIPCWLPSKIFFNLYFNKDEIYLDAAMFYYGDTISRYFEEYLMSKQLVLVSNKDNVDKFQGNKNIPFRDVCYITTVSRNAYEEYADIKTKVESIANEKGKNNIVVLAAFGPASKVLAYDLSRLGIQVIDIGQGIEVAYSDKKLYKGLDVLK